MQNFDVKLGLNNYRSFQDQVIELLNQMEAIDTKLNKTGGSIIRMPEQSSGNHTEMFKLDCIEKKDRIRTKIERNRYYLNLADSFIASLPEKYSGMVRDKYVFGISQVELSVKYDYSSRQILNIIDRLVDRYIERT